MILIKPQLPQLNWNNPLTKGLIFDLPLTEGGGNNFVDLVKKKANNFSQSGLGGNPVYTQELVGRGLTFNGVGSIFAASTASISTLVNNFSMSVIFKATTFTAESVIFGNGGASDGYCIEIASSNGTVGLLFGGVVQALSTTYKVTLGSTNQLVLVRSAGTSSIYLNGSKTDVSTASSPNAVTTVASIGGRNDQTTDFVGTVFSARMWGRVLNPTEIKQLATNPWQIYRKPIQTNLDTGVYQ